MDMIACTSCRHLTHPFAIDQDGLCGNCVREAARQTAHAEEAWYIDPWLAVRAQRNALLGACDWTQLPDVAPAIRDAWAPYRQALRDITTQPDPAAIIWPTAPTAATQAQE